MPGEETDGPAHEDLSYAIDDRPLTARLREAPGPALLWALGATVLVALEASHVASGALQLGGLSADAAGGAANVTSTAVAGGGAGAAVTVGLLGFGLFAVGLAVATWTGMTAVGRLTDRFAVRGRRLLDGAAFGAALGVTGGIALFVGIGDVLLVLGEWVGRGLRAVESLPALTSRETIPNRGYRAADGTWQGTFMGLSPAYAWALRVLVVYGYAAACLGWVWLGYRWFREHYRRVDWTPRDDVVRRLRSHRWGQFGMVITFLFLTMALFAPSLATTTAEQNLYAPFSHSIEYYDSASGSVQSILVGEANLQTQSEGYADSNVGPMSYDRFDRFHPAGTLTNGKDLWTFLTYGARVSLVIGLLSVGASTVFATAFSLLSAYYRGVVDLVLVVTGDTIMGVPRLLMLILLIVILSDTWLSGLYNGGILLGLALAATGWPFLWRSFRGPTLQVAEEEWVDAARSYGQSPTGIMRLHMLPYLVGYVLIYSSMVLGGVILAVAGLSFLGFGITEPTPEWGRAVSLGREYVASHSWHISLLPGVMITLVVMGFNALGDALRDAVDPKADQGTGSTGETEARGGGV
ncbi:ABC transporter permease [Halosimplex sp. J119]